MRILIVILIAALILPPVAQSAEVCLRPVPPAELLPEDDADFRDLIQEDFQRYYAEMQDFLNCLQREEADAAAEIREVTDRWVAYFGE